MTQADKSPISCRLGFHTDIIFYVTGTFRRVYTRCEPYMWDGAKCYRCNNELSRSKKVQKRQQQLDVEVAKIRKEIEMYGHPLLTGITT